MQDCVISYGVFVSLVTECLISKIVSLVIECLSH